MCVITLETIWLEMSILRFVLTNNLVLTLKLTIAIILFSFAERKMLKRLLTI